MDCSCIQLDQSGCIHTTGPIRLHTYNWTNQVAYISWTNQVAYISWTNQVAYIQLDQSGCIHKLDQSGCIHKLDQSGCIHTTGPIRLDLQHCIHMILTNQSLSSDSGGTPCTLFSPFFSYGNRLYTHRSCFLCKLCRPE